MTKISFLRRRFERSASAAPTKPTLSFEFFPPKSAEAERSLWRTFERLKPLGPSFVSVTYGAGGSTRERTHEIVARVRRETMIAPAAHLTCVAASREEVDAVARHYWQAGVRHVVALRGDPPEGVGAFVAHPQGYARAADLVAGLKRIADFEISVACHPEGHPDAVSPAADLDNLKRKAEAGATRAISQFFFGTETFLRFRDRAGRAGIGIPILPGILPILKFDRTVEFAKRCGASIPAWLAELYDGLDSDPDTCFLVSAGVTAELCRRLAAEGVEHFHFYTLNQAALTAAICRLLNAPEGAYVSSGPAVLGTREAVSS